MHKMLSTLLLAAVVPFSSQAQTTPQHRAPASLLHKKQKPVAHSTGYRGNDNKYAAKTTATGSRMISYISFEYDGTSFVPLDSSAVSYTGARGGFYNPKWDEWEWAFDSGKAYEFNPATSSYGSPHFKFSQTFDAANRVTSSTSEEHVAHLGSWRNFYKSDYTYDPAGNCLTEINQDWDTVGGAWKNAHKETHTYTAANKIATTVSESWNSGSGAWDAYYRRTYTYDAGNKLVTELSEFWNMSTSSWENGSRTTNTYDAANNLTVELYEQWDGSTSVWENSGRRTYTYDVANRRTEELYESYMMGVWEPSTKELYSNFDGNQPQTIVSQNWDGGLMVFENTNKEHYTYNSDDHITYVYNEDWNFMTGAWELNTNCSAERYRYETYSTTAIAENTAPAASFILYPVPATQSLTIEAAWTNAEPFTVTITDIAGRMYSRFNNPGQKNYKEEISLAAMQPGNYFVTLETKTGKTTRPLTIVK